MIKRLGKQTVIFENPPSIISSAAIVGPKEGLGPLSIYFDTILTDEMWEEKSWEKAEVKLIKETFSKIVEKSGKNNSEINYVLSGDLLNQCISTTFGLRDTEVPVIGMYGACSTMAETLGVGSMLIDGGFAQNIVCLTSSHFCSAEKQFRYPLELGSQRAPTSQWTVTGSGGVCLSNQGNGPFITSVTTGKIVDLGIKDVNNMGAAMAPAAKDTILEHFKATNTKPDDYDMIFTGDLGMVGKKICKDLLQKDGYDISLNYNDCGTMIFDLESQDVCAGGSGCGCSATTLAGYILKKIKEGNLMKVLFVSTGAMHSTTSSQQGESIPGIAHAVSIQNKLG